MLVRTMHRSTAQCSGLLSVTKKQTHFHTYCTIFPKLCMVIELAEAIRKGAIHFSIQRIVFPTGCMEKFGLIDDDARFLSNNTVTCEANRQI